MARAIVLREAVAFAGVFPLLSGIDLEVELGEVLHLRGANGAGKTSLLRVLAGLVPVASGTAVVLGHDLRDDRRTVRREVGFVGQHGFLYDDLDARANLQFWLRPFGAQPRPVDEALARVGIEGRLTRTRVGALSTGQRRRVELALVYARSPRLWLLDEPHAGLDTGGRQLLDTMIAEATTAGVTVVFSSHELDHAGTVADRSVLLVGGRVPSERVPLEGGGVARVP